MGKGMANSLQRVDSRAAEVFIEGFVAKGRPLLPVHDGFYFVREDLELFERLRPSAEKAVFDELKVQIKRPEIKAKLSGLKPFIRNYLSMK